MTAPTYPPSRPTAGTIVTGRGHFVYAPDWHASKSGSWVTAESAFGYLSTSVLAWHPGKQIVLEDIPAEPIPEDGGLMLRVWTEGDGPLPAVVRCAGPRLCYLETMEDTLEIPIDTDSLITRWEVVGHADPERHAELMGEG